MTRWLLLRDPIYLDDTRKFREQFSKMTLYDMLEDFILSGSKTKDNTLVGPEGDNRGKEVVIAVEDDLPLRTNPEFMLSMAYVVYAHIIMKYIQCTEAERRDVARSDMEFHELVKFGIAKKYAFKTVDECFGSNKLRDKVPTLEVPKIPRGNEMLWLPAAEPDPVYTDEQKIFHKKMQMLHIAILEEFKTLYSSMYDAEFYNSNQLTVVFNTAQKKTLEIIEASKNSDFVTFSRLAVPALVDALVIQPMIRKGKYVNTHKRKKIYNDLVKTVIHIVEKIQREKPEMCDITVDDC